jgi:hypothetical protein
LLSLNHILNFHFFFVCARIRLFKLSDILFSSALKLSPESWFQQILINMKFVLTLLVLSFVAEIYGKNSNSQGKRYLNTNNKSACFNDEGEQISKEGICKSFSDR